MDADKHGFTHSEITDKIIKVFFEVYNELGPGFRESVYERSLELALNSLGLKVCRQIQIPVWFRGQRVGDFPADMCVADCVLLELKAAKTLDSSHQAQRLNYLRATEIEVGFVLNFGLKAEFKRLIIDNPRKAIRGHPQISVADLLIPDKKHDGAKPSSRVCLNPDLCYPCSPVANFV